MGLPVKKLNPLHAKIVDEFQSFVLLEGFPQHLIEELAEASEFKSVAKGGQILAQGQVNDHLFFLCTGQVGVYVDGERISKLVGRGQLLGEMSVITNKPAGATITAETDVEMICMDSRVFLNMKGPQRDFYLSILYRIYAMVLAEKLAATNQKAKHFEAVNAKLTAMQWDLEEANRTLEKKVEERTLRLEQQKAELTAGNNKLEELISTKKFLFQKLADFHDSHLEPLKKHLDELRKAGGSVDTKLNETRKSIFDVQQVLRPLTDQYFNEKAIQSKKVLLCDSNKKQQIIAKMALGGTGVLLDVVSDLTEGRAKIANSDFDLVIMDTTMLELAELAFTKNPSVQLVLMTSDVVPNYVSELRALKIIPHIVSRNEADRTFTTKNILTTVTKLLGHDLFGLEKYLALGVDVQRKSIESSSKRAEIIDSVDQYFEKLGVRRAHRERVRLVLEEMLMNAIYDAPTDKNGKAIYNHLARTEEVNLNSDQQAVVRFATDGMIMAVSVQDPFGSLNGNTLLRYLESNYQGTAADMNQKEGKGGAGRGLHQIVETSDLVVFNIDPGKKTEAIALFNLDHKEASVQHPSFHFFLRR